MEDPKPSEKKNAKELDIFLFWNGQSISPPRKFHLKADQLNSWENTLTHLARLEYDTTYPTIQLHALDGKALNGPEELIDGATYVAVPSPDTFLPSGYDQYLTKASKSRERRQTKRKSVELDNTDVSKDIQTDDRSINIPVDNIVVVNRLEADVKIQKPVQCRKPNNLQQSSRNPSSPRISGVKPIANPANRQRFPGVGQILGSEKFELPVHKSVLNKRQSNSRNSAKLSRPSFLGRSSFSGGKNSDVKTAPEVHFSRKFNNQNSKIPNSNTNYTRPESSMNKLKLPPILKPFKGKGVINNRGLSYPNETTTPIRKQGIISNKISRPTEINTCTELLEITTDEIVKKSKDAFLKKLDAVQSGKKDTTISTTNDSETFIPYDLMSEIKYITMSSTDNIKPQNVIEKFTPFDAVATKLSTKCDPNVPTDLEKVVGVIEQNDFMNLINKELQSRKSEAKKKNSNEHLTTEETTSSKQSPEENVKGNNIFDVFVDSNKPRTYKIFVLSFSY